MDLKRYGNRFSRNTVLQLATVLIGGVLVALATWRDYNTTLETETLRFERAVDSHAGTLRAHLESREGTARVVAAVFAPPGIMGSGALARIDASVLALLPEVFSFVWAPRVPRQQVWMALEALRQSGVDDPRLLGPGGEPLALSADEGELRPVLDIVPKTPANLRSLGLDLAGLPLPRAALDRAMQSGQPAATAPLNLVQLPEVPALVLYAPVRDAAGNVIGFVGFSYRIDRLMAAAIAGDAAGLAVTVRDVEDPEARVLHRAGETGGGGAYAERAVEFGSRTWSLAYPVPDELRDDALAAAGRTAGLGAAGLGIILLIAWSVALFNRRLEAALDAHASAEQRLRVVVGELNHRVKNMLAVVQVVVTRSLRRDQDIATIQETVTGRLQAMAHAVSLLSDTGWRGATMRDLASGAHPLLTERVVAEGPPLALLPQVAQSFALLLHELATNAAKHGALSVEGGRVDLSWAVEGDRFRLVWQEHGGPAVVEPTRAGFGRLLIERTTPAAVEGTCRLRFAAEGFRYELDAPLERLIGAQGQDDAPPGQRLDRAAE